MAHSDLGGPPGENQHGTTFLVTDEQGALPLDARDYGLYAADTRFLSRHELRLNGRRPESVASVRLSFRHARWHMIVDGKRASWHSLSTGPSSRSAPWTSNPGHCL
jgi:N-terminal domain of (some) glycogen debranching enzymes